MLRRAVAVVLLSLLAWMLTPVRTAHAVEWTISGPTGGRVTDLQCSPQFAVDHTAFAVVDAAPDRLYKTADGGITWVQIPCPGIYVNRIALSPFFAADRGVAVGGDQYVCVSADGGATWQSGSGSVKDLAIAAVPGDFVVFATIGGVLKKSTDHGLTWTTLSGAPSWGYVAPSPDFASDNTVFAISSSGGSRLQRSSDGGSTWSSLASTLPASPTCIGAALTSSGTLDVAVGTYGSGIYRLGLDLEWETQTAGQSELAYVRDMSFAADYSSSGRLLVAKTWSIASSGDGGLTWTEGNPVPPNVMAMGAVSAVSSQTAMCGIEGDGVYATDDAGVLWTKASTGIIASNVSAVGVSPGFETDGIAVVGTVYQGLYRTTDYGATWQHVGYAGNLQRTIREVAFSPAFDVDHTVFALTGDGALFRSTDGGSSFAFYRSVDGGTSGLSLSPAFVSDSTLFIAASSGVYKSTSPTSCVWVGASAGGYPRAVAVSPDYASDQMVLTGNDTGIVRRSTDGGSTWTDVAYLGRECKAFAFSSGYTSDGTVWASTASSQVWRSTDRGASWRMISSSMGGDLVANPSGAPSDVLFAGSAVGVKASPDLGAHWDDLATPSPARDVQAIAASGLMNGRDCRVMAGATGGGVAVATFTVPAGSVPTVSVSTIPTMPDLGEAYSSIPAVTLSSDQTASISYQWDDTVADSWMEYDQPFAAPPGEHDLYYRATNFWGTSATGSRHFSVAGGAGAPSDQAWGPLLNGDVRSVRVTADGTVYAASSSAVLHSHNRGHSWSGAEPGLFGLIEDVDALHLNEASTTVLVGSLSGTFLSEDGGSSWRRVRSSNAYYTVAISPDYLADGTLAAGTSGGVAISRDRGLTWSSGSGFPSTTIRMVVFSPNFRTDRTMFCATHAGAYKSSDGGYTWQLVGMSNGFCFSSAVSPDYATDRTAYFGAAWMEDARTMDGGSTWGSVGSGAYGRYAFSPDFPGDPTVMKGVYAGRGFLVSLDGGGTWGADQSEGLPADASGNALATSTGFASDRICYYATTKGLFSREIQQIPDSTAPTTTASGVSAFWTSANPTVTLTATDTMSGVASTYYSLNGDAPSLYTLPFAVAGEGTTTISYWSVDVAGNVEATRTLTVLIDKTPPVSSDDHLSSYSGTATVSVTASDALSGVERLFWSLDAGAMSTSSPVVTTAAIGTHSIEYYAIDFAGNMEETRVATFTVGPPVPVTSIYRSPADPDGTNGWFVTAPVVTLSRDRAGVTYYQLDATSTTGWNVYSAPLIAPEGEHYLYYFSVDSANNTETVRRCPGSKVDTSAPSAATLSAVGQSATTADLSWTAGTDAVSGVAGYRVYDASDDSLVTSTTGTAATVSNLNPSTSYSFYARTLDVAGNESTDSNGVAVRTDPPSGSEVVSVPPGANVTATASSGVEVVFDTVTGAGSLAVTRTAERPHGQPDGFQVKGNAYYDISFSGSFTGEFLITLAYDDTGMTLDQENRLKLQHWKDPGWEDITVSVDTDANTITGRATSFSPFLVGEWTNTAGLPYSGYKSIHGGYASDTDACAGCHRAHTSFSSLTWTDPFNNTHSALLVSSATEMYEFCYACHGADVQGADTNVQEGIYEGTLYGEQGGVLNGGGFESLGPTATTSTHMYTGGGWGAYGGGLLGAAASDPWDPAVGATGQIRLGETDSLIEMDCATCHDPHGSSNYRILKDRVYGNRVGGYYDDGSGFAASQDPTPTPWVTSVETGFPDGGWRLHWVGDAQKSVYQPDFTTPMYARGATQTTADLGSLSGTNKGMTGWCISCHGTYDTTESTYNAGDKRIGDDPLFDPYTLRHRHPMNVPLSDFYGPRALIVTDNPLPLAHDPASEEGSTVANTASDWIECLTCHRAHGTSAIMTGYANSLSNFTPVPNSGSGGVPPADSSALLRGDNRYVCEVCHNQ